MVEWQTHPAALALTDWVIQQGLLRASLPTLFGGTCERLLAMGVPLWRTFASTQTLHPRFRGVGCSWRPHTGTQTDMFVHRRDPSEDFLASPFKYMFDRGDDRLRLRLDRGEGDRFPLLARFREQGVTDYFAQLVAYGVDGEADGESGLIASWATAAPEGFSAEDIGLLQRLLPRLALALEARIGRDIAVNLLDAYVGPEAGRRILSGEIQRGSLEVISAVILYADLRGFTALADRSDHNDLVTMLNQYFDCVVPAITERAGVVLKFLGDGLLATFPLAGRDPAEVCELALGAAEDALERVHALSGERAAAGLAIMDLDLALHLGDVYWGNVGSAERLDFTVIGPAVNEAARIEALCGQHDRDLLISETFAQAATRSAHRLISIGRYGLRGVRSAQSIYALDGSPS